jgi:signal peptidase II
MNFFLVSFLVFLFDQVSKFIVVHYLAPVGAIRLFSFFYLTYRENTGAAFSILYGENSFFIFTSLLVIIILLFWLIKERRYNLSFALIFGGALGNLFDRIFRGRVIDFLDFRIWPVFNFADTAITIGIFLIFWQLVRRKPKTVNCKL